MVKYLTNKPNIMDNTPKTAMMELIEKYRAKKESSTIEQKIYYQGFLNELTASLEKEKTQIVDAYCQGQIDTPIEGRPEKQDANQYFTQTYKQ